LQGECGRRKSERGAGDGGGRRRHHPCQHEQRCDHETGDAHLRRAETEDLFAHGPQSRHRQFKANNKQEQDHAKLGDVKDALFLMQDAETERTDRNPGGEIAENGPEFEAVENRHGNRGGPEIGRRLNQKIPFCCRHALCSGLRRHSTQAAPPFTVVSRK